MPVRDIEIEVRDELGQLSVDQIAALLGVSKSDIAASLGLSLLDLVVNSGPAEFQAKLKILRAYA